MPQMMPINWLFSLFFFIFIFIVFNILNYYIFNMKLNIDSNKKKMNFMKNLNWKW